MAKVKSTSFEVSLTAEEMFVIEQALDSFYSAITNNPKKPTDSDINIKSFAIWLDNLDSASNERRDDGCYLDPDDHAYIAETLREEFKKARGL